AGGSAEAAPAGGSAPVPGGNPDGPERKVHRGGDDPREGLHLLRPGDPLLNRGQCDLLQGRGEPDPDRSLHYLHAKQPKGDDHREGRAKNQGSGD
ncbi:unnamed protein product, partial [Heterosigma akashiwo]